MAMVSTDTNGLQQQLITLFDAPPDEARFTQLVQAFIAYPDRVQFLGTLARMKKAHPDHGYTYPQSFQKLAETLILYEDTLRQADNTDAIRAAYLHYLINTDGPISQDPDGETFDVFARANHYAKQFNIKLEAGTDPETGNPCTNMFIDKPHKPIICADWGPIPGQSNPATLRDVGQVINKSRYGRNDVIASTFFPWDSNPPTDYNKTLACRFADLCELSYRFPDYIGDEIKRMGFTEYTWLEGRGDTQAFITRNDSTIVVCFRGSQQLPDWFTNALLAKIEYTPPTPPNPVPEEGGPLAFILGMLAWLFTFLTGRSQQAGAVHAGFLRAYRSVWREVYETVNEWRGDRALYVTGHSLGAAIGQITAYSLESVGQSVDGTYFYGSPRVGNAEFVRHFDERLADKTFLHINAGDIVPEVLPTWLNYATVSAENIRYFPADSHHMTVGKPPEGTNQAAGIIDADVPPTSEAEKRAATQRLLEATDRELRLASEHRERHVIINNELDDVRYGMTEGAGILSDHSISEYMFKLACCLMDERFAKLNVEREA